MVKGENYINVCGWMINELTDLRLNEVFIYAIIHGFSQDGKSYYTGSLSYLMEWTHSSKPTVIAALSKLVEKGYIFKKMIAPSVPIYYTAKSRGIEVPIQPLKNFNHQLKNITEEGKEFLPDELKNFTASSKESLPNNTNKILKNTSTSKSDTKKDSEEEAEDLFLIKIKDLFGRNVFDSNFIPELKSLFQENEVSQSRVGEYLDYVYKQTFERKPNSVSNLFRVMAKAQNVLQDFLILYPKQEDKKSMKFVCPVCGKDNFDIAGLCSCCHFDFADINNNSEIEKYKILFSLPEEQKEEFNREVSEILFDDPIRQLRDIKFKEQQQEKLKAVYKKYGINM